MTATASFCGKTDDATPAQSVRGRSRSLVASHSIEQRRLACPNVLNKPLDIAINLPDPVRQTSDHDGADGSRSSGRRRVAAPRVERRASAGHQVLPPGPKMACFDEIHMARAMRPHSNAVAAHLQDIVDHSSRQGSHVAELRVLWTRRPSDKVVPQFLPHSGPIWSRTHVPLLTAGAAPAHLLTLNHLS